MFQSRYKWSSQSTINYYCLSEPITSSPYILIPNLGNDSSQWNDNYRSFGMVSINGGYGEKFIKEYIQKFNPRIILWSDIVNKKPDYIFPSFSFLDV